MQKRKGFKGDEYNPAAAFISGAEPEQSGKHTHNTQDAQDTHKRARLEVGYTPNTAETKSKRVNLLIRPTLLEDFAKVAHMKRTSINDLLNRLIADCAEREAKAIRDYNRLFKNDE